MPAESPTERLHMALGALIDASTQLEHSIVTWICVLMRTSEPQTAQIATADRRFPELLSMAKALTMMRVRDATHREKIINLLRRAGDAYDRRNTFVHSTWIMEMPSQDFLRSKSTTKGKSGLVNHMPRVDMAEIDAATANLFAVMGEVDEAFYEIPQSGGWL